MLLIDPGHGGLDGGAVSSSGIRESTINYAVSQKLRDMALLFGLRVAMTRETEDFAYPDTAGSVHEKKVWDQKDRAEKINQTPEAVVISIHQNKYPDSRPWGTQVFYGTEEGSQALGTMLHENLIRYLCPENRRVAAPIAENLFLFRSIRCPAVLVECGFLSNGQELDRLMNNDYQIKLALVIAASYMQYRN